MKNLFLVLLMGLCYAPILPAQFLANNLDLVPTTREDRHQDAPSPPLRPAARTTATPGDATIDSLYTNDGYTVIPKRHAGSLTFTASVENVSTLSTLMDTVFVDFVVRNGASNIVFTDQQYTTNLWMGFSRSITSAAWTGGAIADNYTVDAIVSVAGVVTDSIPSNDSAFVDLEISDSLYARDDGVAPLPLSLGAGFNGYLGQEFDLAFADTLMAARCSLLAPFFGDTMQAVVFAMGANGPIEPAIATSDPYYITAQDTNGVTLDLVFRNGVPLVGGNTYLLALEETYLGNLTLGRLQNIYRPRKTWAKLSSTWRVAEDYNFFVALQLRGIFAGGEPLVALHTPREKGIVLYPNPAEDILNVKVQESMDAPFQVTLFDLRGRKMLEKVLPAHTFSTQLATGHLAPGVYLFELRSAQGRHVERVLIH